MANNKSLFLENEIVLDPTKVIMSKTNHKGIIQYANEYFVKVCGYTKEELIGKPHNIIRHPDMPKIVFKILWERLKKGENLYAVIKNLTKEGNYYWVATKFETTFDENGNIIAHYARRKTIPEKVKQTANNLYKTISAIEKHDVKLAEITFYETLDKFGLTYDDFFLELSGMSEEEVYNYFQSTELNTNTTYDDMILEIDSKQIETKTKVYKDNKNIDFIKEIEQLKKQITALKKQILEKETEKKAEIEGFLGSKSEINQMMKLLKNKKLK